MKKFFVTFLICILVCFISRSFARENNLVQVFSVDPLKNNKPKNICENDVCKSLLNLINNSNKTIDFAIYGIGGEDAIFDALVNAQKRGVIVRGVVDATQDNINIYKDTDRLAKNLNTIKNDYLSFTKMRNPNSQNFKFDITNAIMHNKFFIVDGKTVWTGSTNVSSTCMNYNANNSIVLNSPEIANLYAQEFNQMYEKELFHDSKKSIENNEDIKIGNTLVSVYFLPIHNPINEKIKPLIKNAKQTIDIEIFFLTHKGIINELIDAHKRGVKIRVIADASSANNQFSKYRELRKNGIFVKVENWGGKMHKKSMIVDNDVLVIGSMNWTTSAQYHNDENVLIVQDSRMVAELTKEFNRLWLSIPDKYLYKTPKAEGFESVYSCNDGVDNDHDGKVDKFDEDCHFIKKFTPKSKVFLPITSED